MISSVELNRRLRKVVLHCTGMAEGTVRPADQLGGATGESWATVKVIGVSSSASPSVENWSSRANSTQLVETQFRQHQVTVSFQFFRAGAMGLANKLKDRITLSSTVLLLQDLGLGYVSAVDVKDITGVSAGVWEERAQLDMDFHVSGSEEDTVETFSRFGVNVSVANGTSSTFNMEQRQ